MTIRKEQKTKEQPPEQRDDLALDPETVKDLEPRDNAGAVRGGQSSGHAGSSLVQGTGGSGRST